MDRDIELRYADLERAKLKLRCFELARQIIGPETFFTVKHSTEEVLKIGNELFDKLWK